MNVKRSTHMQSNPRIVVNLLVISANTLVSLLVKPTKLRLGGWAWGGATPDCMSPRGTKALVDLVVLGDRTYGVQIASQDH